MNPVRAGMVAHPGEYRWSSYRVNGQGEPSSLINPHFIYMGLGQTDEDRRRLYRELFGCKLESGEFDKIRNATNGNFSLGGNLFDTEISKILGRPVTPGKAGRPSKKTGSK